MFKKAAVPKQRPLTDQERLLHLDSNTPSVAEPHYALSVTRINSTYIEIVSPGYEMYGLATLFGILSWAVIIFMIIVFSYSLIRTFGNDGWFGDAALVIFLLGPALTLIAWLGTIFFRAELFGYTQYPIRFNRKNRMVYDFTWDGKVNSAPWDEIFFTLSPVMPRLINSARLQGLFLDEKREMVLNFFQFGTPSDTNIGALAQWEFYRRYMEEGPEKLIGQVKYCMPSGKRESFRTGLERISANFPGCFLKLILFPVSFIIACSRWVAMRTCKVPVWPKEVEDACAIEPGDPYVKDHRSNPKDLQ